MSSRVVAEPILTRMDAAVWVLILTIGLFAVLSVLHAMALSIKRETRLHDLKVHVANLRISYLEDAGKLEVAMVEARPDVDIVEDAPAQAA